MDVGDLEPLAGRLDADEQPAVERKAANAVMCAADAAQRHDRLAFRDQVDDVHVPVRERAPDVFATILEEGLRVPWYRLAVVLRVVSPQRRGRSHIAAVDRLEEPPNH